VKACAYYILLIAAVFGLSAIAPATSQDTNNTASSPEALEVARELVSITNSKDMLNEAPPR
jgi:uncharacterized membrane protein